jgi:hypothetical protein
MCESILLVYGVMYPLNLMNLLDLSQTCPSMTLYRVRVLSGNIYHLLFFASFLSCFDTRCVFFDGDFSFKLKIRGALKMSRSSAPALRLPI